MTKNEGTIRRQIADLERADAISMRHDGCPQINRGGYALDSTQAPYLLSKIAPDIDLRVLTACIMDSLEIDWQRVEDIYIEENSIQ